MPTLRDTTCPARDIHSLVRSHRSKFVGADLSAAYRLSAATSVTLGYNYQNWSFAKGPTTIVGAGGTLVINGDAAGGNNVAHTLSVGLKIDLNRPAEASGLKDDHHRVAPRWDGWYGGVTSGMDWQNVDWQTTSLAGFTPTASSAERELKDRGAVVSLFGGRTWQNGTTIWGVEADIGKSNASDTKAGVPGYGPNAFHAFHPDATIATSGWDGSLRARLGTLVKLAAGLTDRRAVGARLP